MSNAYQTQTKSQIETPSFPGDMSHKSFNIADFLEKPLALIDAIYSDLQESSPYVAAPLCQASEFIREAILRDENGPPPAPEYTDEALGWEPPPMPAYTAAAIEGELIALKTIAPANAQGTLGNTSYNIGRWSGGGYLTAKEGKQMIWRVSKAAGIITALGQPLVEKIISKSFMLGQNKPRKYVKRAP